MSVSMSIGPPGSPPSTSYAYDAGVVTLSARPATSRSAVELAGIVASIRNFHRAVMSNDGPAIVAPVPPLDFRLRAEVETPTVATYRFRCNGVADGPTFTVDASLELASRVTSFEARPERSITWGDFDLFLSWMRMLAEMARR
jgi:hypothetical protein